MTYNLTNKTIIITGANSGIGKAAAAQMAKLGANVIMACRSLPRGTKALEDVQTESQSEKVELMQLDLSSRESIACFSDEFKNKHNQLHVLIHNAANFDQSLKKATLNEAGVEVMFATNHVGVFLLTHLLLATLKASAPSRIITVASKGLMLHPLIDIEFDNLKGERSFNWSHAYYHSKMAQVMYTYDLAERLKGTGVTVNCVRVTNVAIPDERLGHLPKWLRSVYSLKRRASITPEKMAETYVYLAADPAVENITGGYWDENNRQVKSSAKSYNRETWKKLWHETERLAGLRI